MNITQSIVLGVTQGLSEFLPISSSAHLILVRMLLGISDIQKLGSEYIIFDIMLHMGTLGAVLIVFWKDWIDILKNPFKSKTLGLLFIASLPTLIVVILFNEHITNMFAGWFLGIAFLITGLFLTISELVEKMRKRERNTTPKIKNAIIMGVMQSISLLPGVSRSGSTLLGGVGSGMTRKSAIKFSFMMSAPAIVGSLLFGIREIIKYDIKLQTDYKIMLIGVVVSFIFGILAMKSMLKVVEKISLNWFALYVTILGIIIIFVQMFFQGVFPPIVLTK